MGGSSTVVVPSKPKRNDSRIPAFGYDEQRGHCIAYPFTNDDGTTRLDFVCFSHDDARLIAAAPALLEALNDCLAVIDEEIEQRKNGGNDEDWLALQALSDRAHAVAAQVTA